MGQVARRRQAKANSTSASAAFTQLHVSTRSIKCGARKREATSVNALATSLRQLFPTMIRSSRIDISTRAKVASAAHFRAISSSTRFDDYRSGYVSNWRDNLIEGVSPDDVERDLGRGSGGELRPRGNAPPKFMAMHSSAALAANSFGPFRRFPARLHFLGRSDFTFVTFEYKPANGLGTQAPNLDVAMKAASLIVGVESKFLEPLSTHAARFSSRYRAPFVGGTGSKKIAESPWTEAFELLRLEPRRYRYLDAAQLIKHYLGLMHSHGNESRALVYLYWEPLNAEELQPFKEHQSEIHDFAARVSGCDTRFVQMTYSKLWDSWLTSMTWEGAAVHVERLRARYEFSI